MESNKNEWPKGRMRRVKKEKSFIEDKKEKKIRKFNKLEKENSELKAISTSATNPFFRLFESKEPKEEDDLDGFDFKFKENKKRIFRKNFKESSIVNSNKDLSNNKLINKDNEKKNNAYENDNEKNKKCLDKIFFSDKEEYFNFIRKNLENKNYGELRQELIEKRINKKIEKYNNIFEKAIGKDINSIKRLSGIKEILDKENPNSNNDNNINNINNNKEIEKIKNSIYSEEFNINEFHMVKNHKINNENKEEEAEKEIYKKKEEEYEQEEEVKRKRRGKREKAELEIIDFLKEENSRLKEENAQLIGQLDISDQVIQSLKRELDSLKSGYSNKINHALENFQNFIEENYVISYKKRQEMENTSKLINELKDNYKFIQDKEKPVDFQINEDLYCGSEKRFIEDFSCIICLNIVIDPLQCRKCDKLFCKICINNHLIKYDFCPNCRDAPFSKTNFSRLLKRILDESEFKCPMKCDRKFLYSDLDKHKSECEKIKNENLICSCCRKNVKGETEEAHKDKCEFLRLNCVYCSKQINKFEFAEHYGICESKEKYCDEGKIYYPVKFAEAHESFFKSFLIKFKITVDLLKNIAL